MSVTKQILGSLVVVGLAVSAQAGNGPAQQAPGARMGSSQGSMASGEQSSATSVQSVDAASGSLVAFSGDISKVSSDLAKGASHSTVWIIEKGSAVSTSAANAASTSATNASRWVVDSAGNVWQFSVQSGRATLTSVKDSTSAIVDSTGKVFTWSGGKLVASSVLVKDSAGNVWEFSKNSTVYLFNGSKAVISKVGGSVKESVVSTYTSSANAAQSLSAQISLASASSTTAPGKDNGAQYPDQHPIQK